MRSTTIIRMVVTVSSRKNIGDCSLESGLAGEKSCAAATSGPVGALVPVIIREIVRAIVVRVRVTARMTGVVAVTVITRRIAGVADASALCSCQQQCRERDQEGSSRCGLQLSHDVILAFIATHVERNESACIDHAFTEPRRAARWGAQATVHRSPTYLSRCHRFVKLVR
jgi:hypothetical protein